MYSIFQWATPLSVAALKQIQPTTLSELSAGNNLIRLMPDGDGETPLDTYVRYKNHPEQAVFRVRRNASYYRFRQGPAQQSGPRNL